MSLTLHDAALGQLFTDARSHNGWSDQPVTEAEIRQLYDLLKFGPTATNSCPARFAWVRSAAGKAQLAALSSGNNQAKILAAPVTVIIGYDLDFAERLPVLFGSRGEAAKGWFKDPQVAATTAFRNSSLQGAYLIMAARAMGLDCGPMSGFDNAGVDRAFFAGTRIKSNFICSLGHGNGKDLFPRNPRLPFEAAGWFA
jgi:3-hydroxypropanoate dehydrogenase